MKRTGIVSLSDSSLNDMLTVPAGHKYEILEFNVQTDGTDDAIVADYIHTGSSYLLTAWETHAVSGASVIRGWHQGLVVEEGEDYGLVPVGGGNPTYGTVTYVDVDFTT